MELQINSVTKLGTDTNNLVLYPLAIQNVILPSCFMVILFVTEKQKILCQISFHTHFKMGKDTQGNKPLINYSTVQRETKLKLPSLLKI